MEQISQIEMVEKFYDEFRQKMSDWEFRCSDGHKKVLEGIRPSSEFWETARKEFRDLHSAFCTPGFGSDGGESFSTKPTYSSEVLSSVEIEGRSRAYVYARRPLGQTFFQEFRYETLLDKDGSIRFRRREFHYLNEDMKREWTETQY